MISPVLDARIARFDEAGDAASARAPVGLLRERGRCDARAKEEGERDADYRWWTEAESHGEDPFAIGQAVAAGVSAHVCYARCVGCGQLSVLFPT